MVSESCHCTLDRKISTHRAKRPLVTLLDATSTARNQLCLPLFRLRTLSDPQLFSDAGDGAGADEGEKKKQTRGGKAGKTLGGKAGKAEASSGGGYSFVLRTAVEPTR